MGGKSITFFAVITYEHRSNKRTAEMDSQICFPLVQCVRMLFTSLMTCLFSFLSYFSVTRSAPDYPLFGAGTDHDERLPIHLDHVDVEVRHAVSETDTDSDSDGDHGLSDIDFERLVATPSPPPPPPNYPSIDLTDLKTQAESFLKLGTSGLDQTPRTQITPLQQQTMQLMQALLAQSAQGGNAFQVVQQLAVDAPAPGKVVCKVCVQPITDNVKECCQCKSPVHTPLMCSAQVHELQTDHSLFCEDCWQVRLQNRKPVATKCGNAWCGKVGHRKPDCDTVPASDWKAKAVKPRAKASKYVSSFPIAVCIIHSL